MAAASLLLLQKRQGQHAGSTVVSSILSFFVVLLLFHGKSLLVDGRPLVRNIASTHEWDRLIRKHADQTGMPVIADFYSDSCGPCRMMAPIFKKVASEFADAAVFVKIDTNAQYELSSRFQVRSLPTFAYFLHGKKQQSDTGGIGEGPLRQRVQEMVRQADRENVVLTEDALKEYYAAVDPGKTAASQRELLKKCADMMKGGGATAAGRCVGAAANQLIRRLKKKYKTGPATVPRFTEEDRKAKTAGSQQQQDTGSSKSRRTTSSSSAPDKPNLHLATKEQLQEELEKRLDDERDEMVEQESADEEEPDPDYHRWIPTGFPERVVIVGGGPAGMAAAIYAARAGLAPLVIAPSMGGQLQGKGVDVENYPGLQNMTGPAVIAEMRHQAAHFGAMFEDDVVVSVNVASRPMQLRTNATGTIESHTLVVATGAESNWLNVTGEYELRGNGVSSCATCDGFLYKDRHVVVVGGGDTAMEDALVLARTSSAVSVVHRRDEFRASKVLADRVLHHPSITVLWNKTVREIIGKPVDGAGASTSKQATDGDDDEEDLDLDLVEEEENNNAAGAGGERVVRAVQLRDVTTGEVSTVDCDAVFVAIGHTPATDFLRGVVDFDPDRPGYVRTAAGSTQTSAAGIFAAGDVADSVYRQAITSAGSGAAAALDAERYLSEHNLGNEAADLEAELMAELMSDGTAGGGGDSASGGNLYYNAYEDAGGRVEGMKESLTGEL